MKNRFALACIVYIGFFATIGLAMYISDSAIPLWAVFLLPELKIGD